MGDLGPAHYNVLQAASGREPVITHPSQDKRSFDSIADCHGSTCEIRMSTKERLRCRSRCGTFGDPPCYELPRRTSDWPKGKAVTPCQECKDQSHD